MKGDLPQVKLLLNTPEFFTAPPNKVKVESDEVTNRTYFIFKDKIVAVGERA